MAEITINTVHAEVTQLRSDIKSISKLLRKVRNHQEDPTGEKAKLKAINNGFNREINITHDFASFLGVDDSTKISRSDGTRKVSAYIKENNLRDPTNGRAILPNDKLRKLLEIPLDQQLTFLNIQKYLSKHYIKPDPPTPVNVVRTVIEPEPEPEPTDSKKTPKRPVVKKTTVKV